MPSDGNQNRAVTGFGFVFAIIFVGSLFVAFSLEYIAPQIPGKYRLVIVVVIIAGGLGAEQLLKRMGVKLTSGNKKGNV